MVYLINHITKIKDSLENNNLGTLSYYYLRDKPSLQIIDTKHFIGQDLISAKGYLSIPLSEEETEKICKPGFKGIDITSSIYKLVGAYLADPIQVKKKLDDKFAETSIKNKFFITQFLEEYNEAYILALSNNTSTDTWVFKFIEGLVDFKDENYKDIEGYLSQSTDVIDLLVLEKLNLELLKRQIVVTKVNNISAYELFLGVLNGFHNAAKKITSNRRRGHSEFKIDDEYDLQDILYVIFKSIFPMLKEEDPTPRVGMKSNRIDLILREEGILLEVKMLKVSDINEKDFVEQLKIDIQSYHSSEWIKHLICFVYDPFGKTKDVQNFYDLNGTQSVNGKQFTIKIIVNPT